MGMMKGGNYNFSSLALANDRYLGISSQIKPTLSGGGKECESIWTVYKPDARASEGPRASKETQRRVVVDNCLVDEAPRP